MLPTPSETSSVHNSHSITDWHEPITSVTSVSSKRQPSVTATYVSSFDLTITITVAYQQQPTMQVGLRLRSIPGKAHPDGHV